MPLTDLPLTLRPLAGPLPMWQGTADATTWPAAAHAVQEAGGRLVSLWGKMGARASVAAAYAVQEGLVWLELPLADGAATYPDLAAIFPAAGRMQRALYDLLGIAPGGAADMRPWLNHGAWPEGWFPLRAGAQAPAPGALQDYPFVPVTGDGVHEIAVGPVHAGIIEPGHFRFSVVGEKILRLEARLGYTHKGIDALFAQTPPEVGQRLAARVSGDSAVAYAWAYCMALESIRGIAVPARAQWLRALLLERERVANHLGDLGALGNDAGFAFGLTRFSRLREDWLRSNRAAFGHRLLMDCLVPGGVAADVQASERDALRAQCDAVETEVRKLKAIYEEHAGLQDRFLATGRVAPPLAARLGLAGLAGRASGQAFDLRADHPLPPYDALAVNMATHRGGDVAARVTVRFEETLESLRLLRAMLEGLPEGACQAALPPPQGGRGAGWVEGWRGEVFVALELTPDGQHIERCHCHDPSWHNWLAIEHAVMGNIVPDFPLINKSFNLSYSGHDR